jgi:hypothetical protein
MTKHIIFTILLFIANFSFGQETKKDSCTKIIGKSEYRLADYSKIGWSQEMVDTLKPLIRQFEKCFCESKDKKFLRGLEGKEHAFITVEPKISNLKSCDGLYSYRLFLKNSPLHPHWLEGIWHQVFLVSNNKVYYLNDLYYQDTLAVNKLIDHLTPELLKSFNEKDIESIRSYGNRSVFWTYNSIEVPLIIYSDKGVIYFDNRRKE